MSLNDRIFAAFEDDPDNSLPFTYFATIVIKVKIFKCDRKKRYFSFDKQNYKKNLLF